MENFFFKMKMENFFKMKIEKFFSKTRIATQQLYKIKI